MTGSDPNQTTPEQPLLPSPMPGAIRGHAELPTLRRSLIIYFLALILLPAAIIGVASSLVGADVARRLVRQQVSDLAELTRLKVERHVDVTEITARLSNKLLSLDVVSISDRECLKRFFQTVLEEYPQLRNAYVGYPDGSFLMVSSHEDGFSAERVAVCDLPHAWDERDPIDGDPKKLGYDPQHLASSKSIFPFREDRQAPTFLAVLDVIKRQIAGLASSGQVPNERHRLIELTLRDQLARYRFTPTIFVGFPDGQMLTVTVQDDGTIFSEWQWHEADGSERLSTRTGDGDWTAPGPAAYAFDPRTRPWYTGVSAKRDDLAWTNVYRSNPSGRPCITASLGIRGKARAPTAEAPSQVPTDEAAPRSPDDGPSPPGSLTALGAEDELLAVAGFDIEMRAFRRDPKTHRLLVPPRAVAVLYETRKGPDASWLPAEPPLTYYDPRTRSWWAAHDHDGPFWTKIYTFASSGKLGITISQRIVDSDGRTVKGVIGVDIDIDEVSRYLASLREARQGPAATVDMDGPQVHSFIVTGDGTIVGFPQADGKTARKTRSIYEFESDFVPHDLLRAKLKTGKDEMFSYRYRGQTWYARQMPIQITNQPWYIWVAASRNDFLGDIDQAGLFALVVGLLAALLAIVVALRLRQRIVGPLSVFADGFQRVREGAYFDIAMPDKLRYRELARLGDGFSAMLRGLQERYHLRRYVSQATLDSISSRREQSEHDLGGRREVRTIWFSDIRGFTAFSERHSPERVISVLNRYFDIESGILDSYEGDIDKFIGDGIMAIFSGPDQVSRAVQAALDVIAAFKRVNEEQGAEIAVGIGINTGDVVVGNMGAGARMDFTVIGDNVNLAARLCDKAAHFQVLVSETSHREIHDRVQAVELPSMKVKGKSRELVVYDVSRWLGASADRSIAAGES